MIFLEAVAVMSLFAQRALKMAEKERTRMKER
jgi:hypothetical protein